MTRELILLRLKNDLKDLGLGDDILGAQSDYLLTLNPTDETIGGIIEGMKPVLKTFQSNLDKARAPKPAPSPQPNPQPAPQPNPVEDMPEWARQMSSTLSQIQSQQTNKSKSESLISQLQKEQVPQTYYDRFLKTVDFEKDYDETATVEQFKTDFNEFKQTFATEAAGGLTPPMQTPQAQKANQIKADIERLA